MSNFSNSFQKDLPKHLEAEDPDSSNQGSLDIDEDLPPFDTSAIPKQVTPRLQKKDSHDRRHDRQLISSISKAARNNNRNKIPFNIGSPNHSNEDDEANHSYEIASIIGDIDKARKSAEPASRKKSAHNMNRKGNSNTLQIPFAIDDQVSMEENAAYDNQVGAVRKSKSDLERGLTDEENDDVRSLINKNDIDTYRPQEKGKVNPLIRKTILELKSKLNNSFNASINASRRSFMKSKAAKSIQSGLDNAKVKEKLMELQNKRINSRKQQEEYMDNISLDGGSAPKLGKEQEERCKAQMNSKRFKNLVQMGELGVDLEELSVGIEQKYEEMLNILRKNVRTIKLYFLERLEEVQKEFNDKIMNEKRQNLGNIKELEQQLKECLEKAKKTQRQDPNLELEMDDNTKSLFAFRQMFSFMKEFKEESYSLILSKPADLDLDFLKSELNKNFIDKYLNGLTTSPRVFATELYRFFYNNAEIDEFEEDVTYGGAMTLNGNFPRSAELRNTGRKLKTGLENNSRAPIIKVIDNKYMVAATRDQFSLYLYSFDKQVGRPQRKSRFSKMQNQGAEGAGGKKQLQSQLVISSDDIDFEVESPGYHCVCLHTLRDGTRYLLLGGNFNKIYKFLLKMTDGDIIEEVVFQGTLNLREKHPTLPRQKINDIFQYKNTKNLVAILSYGYAVTLTIEPGKDDTVSSAKRIHRGNISSATFLNDYQYFITCSGSFSRNHDNTIIVSKCCLAQDLFLKQIHSFSNAHGKFKGVMNVKSSNSIGDTLLVSCGNQDDSRICIWDIGKRELVSQIKIGQEEMSDESGELPPDSDSSEIESKVSFYYLNVIVLDDDPGSQDNQQDEDLTDQIWTISGIIILAASINSVHLYGYDHIDREIKIKESYNVSSDIGSYLSIMQTIKHPIIMEHEDSAGEEQENINVIVGTTEGIYEIFRLMLEFQYSNPSGGLLYGIGGFDGMNNKSMNSGQFISANEIENGSIGGD